MDALRKKYPKWAHRRAYHAKRKRRRKKIRRKTAKTAKTSKEDLTPLLLMHLMGQIQGVPVSRKHGSNVVTGYAGAVVPDRLAPVRSQDERARMHQQAGQRQMAEAFRAASTDRNVPHW